MSETLYEYGTFLNRDNRFIAEVEVNGAIEKVHVPNTGRLVQILRTGVKVQLRKSDNLKRKTKYSLTAAKKGEHWINIDSQLPNNLVIESIKKGIITEFQEIDLLKREVSYGDSRFDLYYEAGERKGFIEVKGVTFAIDKVGMFPDAPTDRGTKHIFELIKAVEDGFEGTILFLMMREDCTSFQPHTKIDANFAKALQTATENGVNVLAYKTIYNQAIPMVNRKIPVYLK